MAFMPLLFAAPALADENNGVTVTITTDQQIVTTTVTLKQAGDDLQVVTKELTDTKTIADTLSPMTSVSDSISLATDAVNKAISDLSTAQTALIKAKDAQAALVAAQAAYDLAQANLSTSGQDLLAAKNALIKATADVNAQQLVVNAEKAKLDALNATPTNGYTYTTNGYVAPTPSASPTPTTVRLPAMWDASTKIEVPFDIKLGNTVYEGQGSGSQVYVTSKGFMSFGQPDYTFWDMPQTQGIYVYQSDWMSGGAGAYIDVTTTDTTLKIEWSLHRFGDNNGPLTNVIWNMTINPTTGEWTGYSTISGNTSNLYGGPRIGVRETAGGTVNSMTAVPSDPTLIQQIENQTVIVNGVTTTLQSLIAVKNTVILAVNNKQVVYDSANAVATSTSVARNKAIVDLASAISTSVDRSDAVVISVKDANTQVQKTYIVVSAEKIAQTPVIIEPTKEPVVPTPEPTVSPTEKPTPTPTETTQPTKEPVPPVVEPSPTPEPSQTPEPEPEPQLPVDLKTLDPESLSDKDVEQLVLAAEAILVTAEQGSPAYEQALEALAVAAIADDPKLPAEFATIPGAAAVLETFNALGNIGADMAPAVREEAEKTVIASVIATGAAVNATVAAATTAAASTTSTSSSTGSGGSSGGSSSAESKTAARRREE